MKAKKNTRTWVLLMATSLLASCGQKPDQRSYEAMLGGLLKHSVPECSVAQALADTTAIFLDAREQHEYNISHIRNAIWVGHKNFDLAHVSDIHKKQPIIVYCSIGYRSEKIAEKLAKAGYTSIRNLYGGIFQWVNEGNQVYNAAGPTNSVHAYNKFWSRWLRKGNKVFDN